MLILQPLPQPRSGQISGWPPRSNSDTTWQHILQQTSSEQDINEFTAVQRMFDSQTRKKYLKDHRNE